MAEYDKFVREKKAFLVKLRTILESELSITVQMIEDVPKVDEAIKNILPEEDIPAPVTEPIVPAEEISKPVEEVSAPVAPVKEIPQPVAEVPAPVEKIPVPEEEPVDNTPLNLVDISTKPVAVKKSAVTDDTKTYSPVKIDKESSN